MRAGPGGKTSLRRSRSSSLEARIAGELPCDDAGQQARLDLQDAAVVHAVAEEGMRHQGVHALLVGSHERAAPCGVSATAGPTRMKSRAVSILVLRAVRTAESAIRGLNSSMRSSAKAGRPKRG